MQWAVLGVLRPYYSLREGVITSKLEARRYGLRHLPERWRLIVTEALRLREGKPGRYAGSRVSRAREAAALGDYGATAVGGNNIWIASGRRPKLRGTREAPG